MTGNRPICLIRYRRISHCRHSTSGALSTCRNGMHGKGQSKTQSCTKCFIKHANLSNSSRTRKSWALACNIISRRNDRGAAPNCNSVTNPLIRLSVADKPQPIILRAIVRLSRSWEDRQAGRPHQKFGGSTKHTFNLYIRYKHQHHGELMMLDLHNHTTEIKKGKLIANFY